MFIIVFVVVVLYYILQIIRFEMCYKIMMKWFVNNDDRFNKYKFKDLAQPNKSNFFGFKIPRDKHFK